MKERTYREAGVDIAAGDEAVARYKGLAAGATRREVLGSLGGFGGLFRLSAEHVLVAGADGVGTKLKLAFALQRHDTIGIDCVAMCVNDVLAQGAEPLFFLDYLATGRLQPEVAEAVVAGVAEGCRQTGCALLGGETAEMPGFYPEGEYDLAGFAVGRVAEERILPQGVASGDILIGLPSSGFHSNGYSLVRRILEEEGEDLTAVPPELDRPLGEALLTPTRIYVRPLLPLLERGLLHGIAHITGGGITGNLPRILPEGLAAEVEGTWSEPPVYSWLRRVGRIREEELRSTFNLGVGMILAVAQAQADEVLHLLREQGEEPFPMGRIVPGGGEVRYR